MYVERSSLFSRPGPLVAVMGVHVVMGYILSVSMGVIEVPDLLRESQLVEVPPVKEKQPEPVLPTVKPDIVEISRIDNPQPTAIPIPEEIVAPPSEIPIPPSQNAIAATEATGPAGSPAQDLKTKSRVEPIYPPAARRAGEEGTVRLRILVDERGVPREVQVAQGSGHSRLDQAAIDAVRKWRFFAATDGSQTVTAWTQVAITFRLTS